MKHQKISVNWGYLLFILAIVLGCLMYLADAIQSSSSIQNLILVVPAVLLVLILSVFQIFESITIKESKESTDTQAECDKSGASVGFILTFFAIFAAYLAGIYYIGFDIPTLAFMLVSIILHGERRWLYLIAYPALFTYMIVSGMKLLLSFPVPTVIL